MIRIRLLVFDMYGHASHGYGNKYPLALFLDLLESVDTVVYTVKQRQPNAEITSVLSVTSEKFKPGVDAACAGTSAGGLVDVNLR